MISRLLRNYSFLVLFVWLIVVILLNVLSPQLEKVGQAQAVSWAPDSAPSVIAMKRLGQDFDQFKSNSAVTIILESDQQLGAEAHVFYESILSKLRSDKKHVEYVEDFWSDPLTAASAQSQDGKAAYVQLYLAGDVGQSLSDESVAEVRAILEGMSPPPHVAAYVTGPAALAADQHTASEKSMRSITAVTTMAILTMLLIVYRSLKTAALVLLMVFVELAAARGVIATIATIYSIGLSPFAVVMLTTLAMAAGTDYSIFLVGRYHEERLKGNGRHDAFDSAYHGIAHVILGSGLTIAGATFCLTFTTLPYFHTLGLPLGLGMLVVLTASLTMAPAILSIGDRYGYFEPTESMQTRRWRRVGVTVARWPVPVLISTVLMSIIGIVALPTYRPSFDDRQFLPADVPANIGYAAVARHFSTAEINPELLIVETSRDLRNSADMLIIDKVAKALFRTRGISRVQTITRPLGEPIVHSSLPFLVSAQGALQKMNEKYQQDMIANILKQADDMQSTIDSMMRMQNIAVQMAAATHSLVIKTKTMTTDFGGLRDHIADFDDFFRPIRNYLYWDPHCYDLPACWAFRSVFDALDGIDNTNGDIQNLLPDMQRLDTLMPQMASLIPSMVAAMKNLKTYLLSMYQTQKGLLDQMSAMQADSAAMGQAFDEARNDDSFYLPPEAFQNEAFQRGLRVFISPDGRTARFIIIHEGDPSSEDGISHIDAMKVAAKEAVKGTPWAGAKIYTTGTASTYADMQQASKYDLLIAGIASICLIFAIMIALTRALVASAVIVGTVVLSLGTSFGLSVLIWQNILGLPLHWMILAMSVIVLLAVGSDYNLLLVSRMKEEVPSGVGTGIIRAMAGTGSTVTWAGLVFAVTMISMLVSPLRVVGQVGSTIGIGLLFDTLIIRSLMTPSIASLLGTWFWWPQRLRLRPRPMGWPDVTSRRSRQLQGGREP